MKPHFLIISFILSIFLLYSCGGETSTTEETASEDSVTAEDTVAQILEADKPEDFPITKQGITIYPLDESKGYAESMLSLNTPEPEASLPSGSAIPFNFTTTNYKLGVQTPGADTLGLANSAKGQHIHLILNNNPYSAHYEPEFEKELEDGHYVALAFLSRSYHESVKNPSSYVVRQFTVGEYDGDMADLNAPHLFYSRPKGTYTGDGTKKLLLDFYPVNCELSETGYKVKVTVNKVPFTISEWHPYILEGLPMGENIITLELVDNEGSFVEGPFNKVTRTVTLKEKADSAS